jgi:hypothetical protein
MYDEYGNPQGTTTGLPAIDATYNMNGGVGSSIRLKWDNENYVLVTHGGIHFYINAVDVAQITSAGMQVIPIFG